MSAGLEAPLQGQRRTVDAGPYERALLQLLPPHEQGLLLAACLQTGAAAARAWADFVGLVRDPKTYFETNHTGLKSQLPFVEAQLAIRGIDAGKAFHTYARVALVREELRSRIYAEILESALGAFDVAGIPVLLLKGAALSATVYPQPSTRHNHAIDLLVDARHWAAHDLLAQIEFTPGPAGPGSACHQDFRHSSGLALGLHSKPLFLPHFDMALDGVRARARSVQVGLRTVKVMSAEDSLVHICGHAVYSRSRANLRWAGDVFYILERHPEIQWPVVIEAAARARLTLPLLVFLRWAKDVLAAPVPADALRQLHDGSRVIDTVIAEGIHAAFVHTGQSRMRTFKELGKSPRAQARLIKFSALPSRRYMRWKHNLAQDSSLALHYADRPRRVAMFLARWATRRIQFSAKSRVKARSQGPLVSAVSPEFELMCLTGRVAFTTSAEARIRALVAFGIDWSACLAAVERNFVAPLVYRNLKSIAASGIPAKVLDTLRVRSKITAFKNDVFATELVRLAQLFESKSIEIISYKGAATAHEYYGSITLRNFNDLDFLVRRADLPAMVDLLESEGYELADGVRRKDFAHYIKEYKEFLFRRGEISLEPHWSLTGRRYPFETDYEGFWRRSRKVSFRGIDLRVLSGEDSLLVLCLVGAKGRWKRLQMVTDIAACIHTCPNLDWASIEAMARITGTVRILHLGLLLAAELAGAQLTESIRREIRRSASVRKLARRVVESLATAPVSLQLLNESPAIFSPLLFGQRERYKDRWTYLWRTTTTPNQLHLQRLPLPDPFFPLYRLLVPLHDFVALPAWKLGKKLLAR